MNSASPLAEWPRILVLEDEYHLAAEMSEALTAHHFIVAGPYGLLSAALFAEPAMKIDGAIVDLNLHGELAYEFADYLDHRDIPRIIVTGYCSNAMPERYRDGRCLRKPVGADAIMAKLMSLMMVH
jgi:DNA-binding response OmpR family regulator